MPSIKFNKKIYKLLLLLLLLLVIGIFAYNFLTTNGMVKDKKQYINIVRPYLERVIDNPSPQNITQTEDFLLNIKSSDQTVGDYHLPLYMSFLLWSKYLKTGDLEQKTKAMGILEGLKITLPELNEPLDQIIKIMQNNV